MMRKFLATWDSSASTNDQPHAMNAQRRCRHSCGETLSMSLSESNRRLQRTRTGQKSRPLVLWWVGDPMGCSRDDETGHVFFEGACKCGLKLKNPNVGIALVPGHSANQNFDLIPPGVRRATESGCPCRICGRGLPPEHPASDYLRWPQPLLPGDIPNPDEICGPCQTRLGR